MTWSNGQKLARLEDMKQHVGEVDPTSVIAAHINISLVEDVRPTPPAPAPFRLLIVPFSILYSLSVLVGLLIFRSFCFIVSVFIWTCIQPTPHAPTPPIQIDSLFGWLVRFVAGSWRNSVGWFVWEKNIIQTKNLWSFTTNHSQTNRLRDAKKIKQHGEWVHVLKIETVESGLNCQI